jgi:hypothetical protein
VCYNYSNQTQQKYWNQQIKSSLKQTLKLKNYYPNELLGIIFPKNYLVTKSKCAKELCAYKWNQFINNEELDVEKMKDISKDIYIMKDTLKISDDITWEILTYSKLAAMYSIKTCRIHENCRITGEHIRQFHHICEDNLEKLSFMEMAKKMMKNKVSHDHQQICKIFQQYVKIKNELLCKSSNLETEN